MIRDRVRIRIRYVHATAIRVVSTPVDDRPGALDLEASVRYYREHFVFVRYTQQFAIFTEENWLAVVARTVAYRNELIVRELDEVFLVVRYDYTLGARAAKAVAVKRTESTGDRAFVTNRVKQCVVHRVRQTALTLVYFSGVKAAVVSYSSFAVSPKAWVKVLAVNIGLSRRQASWLQLAGGVRKRGGR